MKYLRSILMSLAASMLTIVASAQQNPVQAVVSSLSGSATITSPGSTKSTPVVVGLKLPEGSIVSTSGDSTVVIESHEGIHTGISPKTTVVIGQHSVSAEGIRTAFIDLKIGTTVSVLDPSKHAINNYAVRTPKGVASAHGTTYTTTVTIPSAGEIFVTVNTISGEVIFTTLTGAKVAIIGGNSGTFDSSALMSFANAIATAATPEAKQAIVDALRYADVFVSMIAQANEVKQATPSSNEVNQATPSSDAQAPNPVITPSTPATPDITIIVSPSA